MSDDLAAQLRTVAGELGGFELGGAADDRLTGLLLEAADRIAQLEREAEITRIEIDQLQEALIYAADPDEI